MFSSMSLFHLSALSSPSFFTDPSIALFPVGVPEAIDASSLLYPSTMSTEMSALPEDLATPSSSPKLPVILITPPSPIAHSFNLPFVGLLG